MDVEEILRYIRQRPMMYLGCKEIEALDHFIAGIILSNLVADRSDYVDNAFSYEFHDWTQNCLEKQYNIKMEDHRDYLYYIKQVCKNSEEGLELFFELSREFFKEVHQREGKIIQP